MSPLPLSTRRPDVFIVGAPKCGTTAMSDYLDQHPDVFMATKELHYFGADLVRRRTPPPSLDEYLGCFKGAGTALRLGEASVRYLVSVSAAAEIRAFSPDARIIIMLRDPVELMVALHAELAFSGVEDIQDFATALDAEPDRRAGRRITAAANVAEDLFYRSIVDFAPQVERYLGAFGRDRVLVLFLEDLRRDPAGTVASVYRFLGVDDRFQPVLAVTNPRKKVRSGLVRRLVSQPPGIVRAVVRGLTTRALRKTAYQRIQRLNARRADVGPLPVDLRARLEAQLAPDTARLEALLQHPVPYRRLKGTPN